MRKEKIVAIGGAALLIASVCQADAGSDEQSKLTCPSRTVSKVANRAPTPNDRNIEQSVNVYCASQPSQPTASSPKVIAAEKDKDQRFDIIKFVEALSKILGSIAWPVAATLIGFSLRSELRGLFGRLESLKYKDAEAKFNKQLLEAEKSAPPVSPQTRDKWQEASARGMFTQYEQIRRIAEISPRAAILEAWIDVEVAIYAAAKKAGLEVKGPSNTLPIVRSLISLEKIPKDVLPFFDRLRKLRNEAAHLPDFVLDQVEAEKYLDLALGLANTFREYATGDEG